MPETTKNRIIFLLAAVILAGVPAVDAICDDCKIKGCPTGQRCMGDSCCTALSVEEYCHSIGFLYDITDPEACNILGEKCENLSDATDIEEATKLLCRQCQGDCELKKFLKDVETAVYGIAAGLAILMLIVNGVYILTSQDPEVRDNAKKSIVYIIIALILIIIAVEFVKYVLG